MPKQGKKLKLDKSVNTETIPSNRGLGSQFCVQISAQNPSQILDVWVQVWTKQTQKKSVFGDKTRFATKARFCPSAALASNNCHNHSAHIRWRHWSQSGASSYPPLCTAWTKVLRQAQTAFYSPRFCADWIDNYLHEFTQNTENRDPDNSQKGP